MINRARERVLMVLDEEKRRLRIQKFQEKVEIEKRKDEKAKRAEKFKALGQFKLDPKFVSTLFTCKKCGGYVKKDLSGGHNCKKIRENKRLRR